MMIFAAKDIVSLLSAHAYEVLLPLSIAEGPVVTIASGFLVATGHLKALPAFGILIVGDLIGDALFYAFGRSVGTRVLARWAKPNALERARKLQHRFLCKSDRTLVVGKLTHSVGALVLIVAGMVKVSFPRFMTINFLATLPKSLVLLLVGYVIGSGYDLMPQNLTYVYLALLVIGVVAIYAVLAR